MTTEKSQSSETIPVRIAVIGTGFGSRVQIPGFLKIPGVEIAGIMSTGRQSHAEQVAKDFQIPLVATNIEQLLQIPNLDAVSIVSPPYQHAPQTLAALAAGKHVLCEKPMARDVNEARAMLEATRRSGLIGMIDHEFRYVPARAYMRQLISDGYLGALYMVNISMLGGSSADPEVRPFGWLSQQETGGGYLGALGSHYIDAIHYLFGDIAAIAAQLHTFVTTRPLPGQADWREVETEDSFTLLCNLAHGPKATINVSVVTRFGAGERIEAYGKQGTLVIDAEGHLWGGKNGDERLRMLEIPAQYTGGLSSDDPRLRPFVVLATDFINAIRATKQAGQPLTTTPSPSFYDGYRVQQVMDAARQAAETNSWISLPPPR
jgi:predicted dehydrogenase